MAFLPQRVRNLKGTWHKTISKSFNAFRCLYLQQKIDEWSLLAGRCKAEVVYDQDAHEVKNELLSWVIGQIRLDPYVAVL